MAEPFPKQFANLNLPALDKLQLDRIAAYSLDVLVTKGRTKSISQGLETKLAEFAAVMQANVDAFDEELTSRCPTYLDAIHWGVGYIITLLPDSKPYLDIGLEKLIDSLTVDSAQPVNDHPSFVGNIIELGNQAPGLLNCHELINGEIDAFCSDYDLHDILKSGFGIGFLIGIIGYSEGTLEREAETSTPVGWADSIEAWLKKQ
jgi:hypothetical protein